jgi:hypothetical protein
VDFEILETGNVIEWGAYAMNPSHYEVFIDGELALTEEWNGGAVEYVADGLAHGVHTVLLKIYHYSQHYQESSTSADVEDLTAPSAISGPVLIEVLVGDAISTSYSSSDPSGITWAVNNTVYFTIHEDGILRRAIEIPAGVYVIQISATDPYGHTTTLDVTVVVSGPGLPPTTMLLLLGGGAGVAVVVVIIVMLKKKGT